MRDYLILNGKNLMDFGLYAFGNSRHKFPERDVEVVEIPGRTGNLTLDKGRWKNIEVEYSVVIVGDGEFKVDELRAFLLSLYGYVKIESTFEPEYYRMGRLIGTPTPKAFKEAATVTLTFDCMPQKFLKSGQEAIDVPPGELITIYNPTMYTARPLISAKVDSLYQTGTITVTNYIRYPSGNNEYTLDIGHSIVTVKRYQTTWIYLDCETKMAYSALAESAMDKIESIEGGDWPMILPKRYTNEPYIQPGFIEEVHILESYTTIQTEHMNDIYVVPRWWTL